jgi:hypothetical protein
MNRNLLVLALIGAGSCLFGGRESRGSDIGVFGSYYATRDTGDALGAGVKWGITLVKPLTFDIRGTYYRDISDRNVSLNGNNLFDFKIRDIPVEEGLTFHFAPDKPVNPFLGGGAGYHFLSSNAGRLNDEWGYYANGVVVFGKEAKGTHFFLEGMYREIKGQIRRGDSIEDTVLTRNIDIQLRGYAVNAGAQWEW